jgi:hypothetical protein
MLAPNPKLSAEERLAKLHRANVEECAPLLDHSIPLGVLCVAAAERAAIDRYYRAKHARGEYGAYWPLHRVSIWKHGLHEIRRGSAREG